MEPIKYNSKVTQSHGVIIQDVYNEDGCKIARNVLDTRDPNVHMALQEMGWVKTIKENPELKPLWPSDIARRHFDSALNQKEFEQQYYGTWAIEPEQPEDE